MCHHPDLQERVSHEIDKFVELHGKLPTFDERTELPLCISVLKECMRYRPTTYFGLPHTVDRDIEVDGYLLPKGCTIIANMGSMHKNPKQYPVHPESFLPERYMNNLKTMQAAANGKLDQRDHFNFGFGRRLCPGTYLAEVELFNAFVQVFAKCKIEPISQDEYPDISNARENSGLNILPPPYKVKFIKREDALMDI
ncbi:cytochrome P450 CYP5207 [Mucor lusitanicus CBS 277.49]|uniref:Cytochrome P450 CYP5207 n=2 Tax=Mucor circinelloides f. lusitanicus TaxID=29924 RepID=A0A168HP18_MUCCL|nr:cytochrome P450 CYP5207 [Mucor lusitanicus CBS 277.49]